MHDHTARIIGILGGMGPAATADFYHKFVQATPARRDQDHPRALIWSDPSIPDRASAYLHGGESPVPGLLEGARRLEDSGADFIAVPCNTAHLFLEPVREQVSIPILDMIEATVRELSQQHPAETVALWGTSATVNSGIYQRRLHDHGLTVLETTGAEQETVSEAIAAVKAGDSDCAAKLLAPLTAALPERGAKALIGGCTELPIAIQYLSFAATFIDPAAALARACVARVRSGASQTVYEAPIAS